MKYKVHIIFLTLFLLHSFISNAQQFIQVKFKNESSAPFKSIKGIIKNEKKQSINTYNLTFKDVKLTNLIKNYDVVQFEKSYPSVTKVNHKKAEALSRVYTIKVQSNVTDLLSKLKKINSEDIQEIFLASEPIALTDVNPNDYFSGYNVKGYPMGTTDQHLDYINVKKAWELTRGLECITIGITDQAFQHNADLDSKVLNLNSLPWYLLYPENTFPTTHGTQVAGDAAAIPDNGFGMVGVGGKVTLRYYSNDINSILDAAIDSCKVINCSWTTGCNYSSYDQDIIDIVHDTYQATIVAAAGNGHYYGCSGGTEGLASVSIYPASYNHVISVTTVSHRFPIGSYTPPFYPNENWIDCHEQIIGSSSYNHNSAVDICAPGYDVTVLCPTTTSGYGNGVETSWGTSLSSPIVAGAAALLYSLNPNFTPDQVEGFLKNSANSSIYSVSQNAAFIGKLGAGKLDVGAAATLASAYACQPNFTDIIWKSGRTTISNNNYASYLSINPVLSFSINTASVTTGSTVEWEFISGNEVVTKTGNSVNIEWGVDFSTLVGNLQRYDAAPLEVYVRQGSSRCYSAYYKEKGYTSTVSSGSDAGPYPLYNCKGNLFLSTHDILSGNYKAENIYAGSYYGLITTPISTTPLSFITNFTAAKEIRLKPGFKATAAVNPSIYPPHYTAEGYFHAFISSACEIPVTGTFSSFERPKQSQITKDSASLSPVKNVNILIEKIYPNPVHNQCFIDFKVEDSGPVNITVLDITGKVIKKMSTEVRQSNVLQHIEIDMTTQPQGTYIIKISNLNGEVANKINKTW